MGALIAGGRATRFGSDKALAMWRGRPLIAWAQDAIATWCERVVVCGRAWDELTALPDLPEPGLGPLGGIAAALAYADRHGFTGVLTIGCDMPDVPAGLLAELARAAPAWCPDAPILGHWPASEADALLAHLTTVAPAEAGPAAFEPITPARQPSGPGLRRGDGRLSVRRWATMIGATAIPAPAGLRNVNTPADLIA